MTLKMRLAFLETDARPAGGVVVYRHGESQDAAMARAYAAGVRGGVLLVPQVMKAEQWEPMAREQQAALLAWPTAPKMGRRSLSEIEGEISEPSA